MSDRVVGVRLEPGALVVFCRAGALGAPGEALERGRRVTIAWEDGAREREGVVAIAPDQIVAAPSLDDAPRIAGVAPATQDDADSGAPPPGAIFLTPEVGEGGKIGPDDLRQALRLAALSLPEAPPERRRSTDGDG